FIGQLMVQLASRQAPGRLVVSEPHPSKRARALELGAHQTVDPSQQSVDELIDMLDGGADVVIECVGRTDTMETAVRVARKGGQVLLFGVAAPGDTIPVSPFEIFRKELAIRGSFINPNTHAAAIALAAQGIVKLSPLVSHRWTLQDVPDMMRRYPALGVSKGLIVMD
ncbi:MAG: zinc-binding dehydrogenase, partial [Chloroflexota bacterium]|nr:zinc-binding dehydrogenase [Chloroflexota bacterium]